MPRAPNLLILGVPAAGLALGSLAWLSINAASTGPAAIADLDSHLAGAPARLRRPLVRGADTSSNVAFLLANPLLKISAGQAGADPKVRLEGIALTPAGGAALLALGGAPAIWLRQGESRAGVTLRRVDRARVTLESLSGEHDVTLGDVQGGPVGPAPFTGVALAPSTRP